MSTHRSLVALLALAVAIGCGGGPRSGPGASTAGVAPSADTARAATVVATVAGEDTTRAPGPPPLVARRGTSPDSGALVAVSPPDLHRTRVLVSRREVRVVFPPETDGVWGWPSSSPLHRSVTYRWSISTAGIMGARDLGLYVLSAPGQARDFPSLDALVAAGRVQLCAIEGIGGPCTNSGVTATVDSGRVVLVLRDSAQIADLFGLRQPWVRPIRGAPRQPFTLSMDTVRVEYVAPQIPEPSAALRAEVERRRLANAEPPRVACVDTVVVATERSAPSLEPAVIRGRVRRDAAYGGPASGIGGANAYIPALSLSVGTAADGTFELRVPPERLVRPESLVVRVRSVGYRPISRSLVLRRGSRVRLDVPLCPDPIRLSH